MRAWLYVCGIGLLFAISFVLPEYHLVVLSYVGLATIAVVGLGLLTGGAGITSFGQAAFVGIGAYTTGFLTSKLGYSPIEGLVAGFVLTGLAAYIIGAATLRLSGHYLALSTIAWGVSLFFVLGNLEQLGGHTGMSGIPALNYAGIDFSQTGWMFILIWLAVLGTFWTTSNILKSRTGRALRALKSDLLTAESFGVDTFKLKTAVFVYAALLSSLAGWLYAHFTRFVNPTPFSLSSGVEYQFMTVIGGTSTVWGALIGSSFVVTAKEWLQTTLPSILGAAGSFEIIIFGAIVLVLLQINQDGGIASVFGNRLRSASDNVVEPSRKLSVRTKNLTNSQPLLEVKGLTRKFGGLTAVDNVNFEINRGEIVALIGPNGAGKTTLFNMISGADKANSGEVVFDGITISHLPARNIVGLGLARTFQHVHLVGDSTAAENVMLGAHLRSDRGLIAAALGLKSQQEQMLQWDAARQLNRVGLSDYTFLSASSLALGQQRVLEIARSLAADPSLLLLDEPAAGLRSNEKRELSQLIKNLKQEGRSVLLVEHDLNFVMNLADRVIVVNFGKMLASGLPEEIQSNAKVIEAYVGSDE